MPASFPAPPPHFVGRDEYVARFKARLDHFRFFLYEGIAGIGKTSLVLRLASESESVGLTGALYMPVYPGERLSSIWVRVEARVTGTVRTSFERQGDPYARLVDLLESSKQLLILDNLENLTRDDLTTMVRVFKSREGSYRVVGAIRGDPQFSNIDRAAVHMERLGALTRDDVVALGTAAGLGADALETLRSDAARGGCSAHPLALRYLLELSEGALPDKAFLTRQSARSVTVFKMLMGFIGDRLSEEQKLILGNLARIAAPVPRQVAVAAMGDGLVSLIERGLVAGVDGDVYAHPLVGQVFSTDAGLSSEAAAQIASALKERGRDYCEPMATIRAGELLARSGNTAEAVETLSSGWEAIRDLGFLESYLKTLASISAQGEFASRLKLLAARARMRQGAVSGSVRTELETLATADDLWTRARALAALTYVYSQVNRWQDVVDTFAKLRAASPTLDVMLPAGSLAAEAMVRVGAISDAEELAKLLLDQIEGDQDPGRQGELHRLLGRVYGQAGNLSEALDEVQKAAACFESAGDLYHAATAFGSIGDLFRQAGEFEHAREAFGRFLELARKWGDRDLIQIAELSEAWVSLDIGDLPHAAKRMEEVRKEMSAAPSRRLKRYMAAAEALLAAGRGHHEQAAESLADAIPQWEAAGQPLIADVLRAQQVRSLIACDKVEKAEKIVGTVLDRVDPDTDAPRVATFMRENALIHLRRRDPDTALQELSRASKLFAQGGNRREEAMTLHRIAHAALEEGNIELAASRAAEAAELAREIKHARAQALAQEVEGRIALINDEAHAAVEKGKESLAALRKLGDELGALHVSEWLLRAELIAGDVASVLRTGPKVAENAQRLEIREVRVRAIVLTGVALLRRMRLDAAQRCFRDLPDRGFSPWTRALTWRFGEALASVQGQRKEQTARTAKRVQACMQMNESRRPMLLQALQQLDLPPRDRCHLRTESGEVLVGTEQIGLLDPSDYMLFVDVMGKRIYDGADRVQPAEAATTTLLLKLAVAAPEPVPFATCYRTLFGELPNGEKPDKRVRAGLKGLQTEFKKFKHVTLSSGPQGIKLTLPKRYAFLIPTWVRGPKLSDQQKKIIKLLRRYASLPLQSLQEQCSLSRAAARREMGGMVEAGLVETIRAGRGQAYRLA